MIYVVDAIMSKGKTSAAFKYMNEHPTEHFMYVTPFLSECERAQAACPALHFEAPNDEFFPSKSIHLNILMRDGKNIVLTHSLFKYLTESAISSIQAYHYTLILDEELEVVDDVKMTTDDQQILKEQGLIRIDPETKQLQWLDPSYEGEYRRFKDKTERKTLYLGSSNAVLWVFPPALLLAFEKVFVLTFLFNASTLSFYCRHFNISYEYWHVEDNILLPGYQAVSSSEKERFRELIQIHEERSNLNRIGATRTALSKSWYQAATRDTLSALGNNAANFLRHYAHASVSEVMWSTFSDYEQKVAKARMRRTHIPCNSRATNVYADKSALAYLVNIYPSPVITNYLSDGESFDAEAYALSQLLQWIWRSRIRRGESIRLYIPSSRMRRLLQNWLRE
jgi:hypothetical protein